MALAYGTMVGNWKIFDKIATGEFCDIYTGICVLIY